MTLKTWWDRLMGREREKALEREAEEEKMAPEERRFVEEGFQNRGSKAGG